MHLHFVKKVYQLSLSGYILNTIIVVCVVLMRLVELSDDVALVYKCNYLETDDRCRTGHSNLFIIGRTTKIDIADDILAQYADIATNLCLDDFTSEFIKLILPGYSLLFIHINTVYC